VIRGVPLAAAPSAETLPPPAAAGLDCPRARRAFRLRARPATVGGGAWFWAAKRLFDLALALVLLPTLVPLGATIALLNLRWNPGPLFFVQARMGRDCRPFPVVKFRTMRPAPAGTRRGPDAPVEVERITPLGHRLRRTRLDELPQVLNVLLGQMSFVGPRPDCWEHARVYLTTVPGYRARHAVRPGLSGLAQVRLGYAEGTAATVRKTRQDLVYVKRASASLELAILLRTLPVVVANARDAR
jgi:lipopolysaccharide/colanic/teichoic acid biosynthesis glycosyltransferase